MSSFIAVGCGIAVEIKHSEAVTWQLVIYRCYHSEAVTGQLVIYRWFHTYRSCHLAAGRSWRSINFFLPEAVTGQLVVGVIPPKLLPGSWWSVFFHRSCHRAAGDLQYRRFPTLTLHFLKLNIRCYTKLIVINILSVDNIFSWQLGSSDSNGTLYIYISLRRQLLSYLRLWFPWQISAPADVEQHLFLY